MTIRSIRSISYGGGVQSTALLVLAAQGVIDYNLAVFANVGDDSEYPETLTYVREYAAPFAAAHGIELVEVTRSVKGQSETVRSRIMRADRKSQVIPVRSSMDGPPMSRSCTVDFKIRQIGKELKSRGASAESPAIVAVGISLDEMHRANRKPSPYERITYPLLGMEVDGRPSPSRPLRRDDCESVIRDAGLPVPPKSACYFCPFHSINEWVRIRRDEPALFADAQLIEQAISDKAGSPRYLTRRGVPLGDAIPTGVDMLPLADDSDADCDTGVCMT